MNQSNASAAAQSDNVRRTALRVQFVITSLPVGGAETLLANLLRRFNPARIRAEVCCLKERGELASEISEHVPVHAPFLHHKFDLQVLPRLAEHFCKRRTDAVITVGAGDKMFWGRLAAHRANVPLVCSALHSTGWPDEVGWLNRSLTGITSGFIACAEKHARYLIERENLPADRVFVVPNGVDTEHFRPDHSQRNTLRAELGIPSEAPLIGIVAALREEKNHYHFVAAAEQILGHHPSAHFIIVGDGPERSRIEVAIRDAGVVNRFHMLGLRRDTEKILPSLDVFCLTSRNEANPVSILEAFSCGVPVVSTDVGSVSETVIPRQTGLLAPADSVSAIADAVTQLLSDPVKARNMGLAGRQLVRANYSLEAMVGGYEKLIGSLYNAYAEVFDQPRWCPTDLHPEDPHLPVSPALIPCEPSPEGWIQSGA